MQSLILVGMLCLFVTVLTQEIDPQAICLDEGDTCKKNGGMFECCRRLNCMKRGKKFTCQKQSGSQECIKKGKQCNKNNDCCFNRKCKKTLFGKKTCQ